MTGLGSITIKVFNKYLEILFLKATKFFLDILPGALLSPLNEP